MTMEFGKKKTSGKVFCKKSLTKSFKKPFKKKRTNKNMVKTSRAMEIPMSTRNLQIVLWAISTILENPSKGPCLVAINQIAVIEE